MGKHIPLWALPPFLPLTFSGAPYPFLFIPVSSFRSLHAGLFMPENFVFGLSRTPSYHLVMRNTYRFWKETRFKFFNFKILQVVFCLFNYGQFRYRFIFYTALVFTKVLAVFRQSGSFHMSLTITNFFQQWDFLCDCLLSAKPKKTFLT